MAKNFVTQYVKGADQHTAAVVYTHPMPKSGVAAMYAVNVGSAFVLVSADDVAHPVLGYSLSRPWPTNETISEKGEARNASIVLPSQIAGYLDDLAGQIESAAGQQGVSDQDISSKWRQLLTTSLSPATTNPPDSVGPLLTTTWDQDQYYNALCPEDGGGPDGHAYAGCVATAMAQIINYWGYPMHGRGTHSYETNYGTLTVNYDSANYDYANMPATLTATSAPAQVNAVATLMRDCGVAANMGYGSNESGAYGIDARAGLINFFYISPNASYAAKAYFTADEWDSILQTDLSKRRPIYYGGYDGYNGHAFVCDGYNSDSFYHFNFGWSGYADGWYVHTAINPNYQFNSGQNILFGLSPDSASNVILNPIRGTNTFIVNEPFELFHLQGLNQDSHIENSIGVGGTTSFIPFDTTKQIVLDFITHDAHEISIYDGLGTESLIRVVNVGPNTDYSPIISTEHSLSVFSNGQAYEGFHLHISMEDDCRMVSNINTYVDTATVLISWNENGASSEWEIEYGLQGFVQGQGRHVRVDTTEIVIDSLPRPFFYDIYIKPVCGAEWKKNTVYVATYWPDVVSQQPTGYTIDSTGVICISSAEGLAYWARLAIEGYNNGNLDSRDIKLVSDIDLMGNLWKVIPFYAGNIDGHGHSIKNMKIYEPNGSGAFIETFSGGIIKDLGIEDYDVRGYQGLAGLALYNANGKILNCFAKNGYLQGMEVGGLLGYSYGEVKNCYSIGIHANASGYTSGLVRDATGLVQNCYSFFRGEERGWTLSAGVVASSFGANIDHCYSGDITVNVSQGIVVGAVQTASWIRDTSVVELINGQFMLRDSVLIDTQYYGNLRDALNQFVITNGDSTWKKWEVNEDNPFPVFGAYNTVSCSSVTGLTAKNEMINNQISLVINWMGSAPEYEIICYSVDSVNKTPIIYHTADTSLILANLNLGETYKFCVRTKCDSSMRGPWCSSIQHTFDKLYWHEVVTSQPSGFYINNNIITISSAEGLTWLARGLNWMEPSALPIGNGSGYIVNIVGDIDLGLYKWEPIGVFSGTINGHNCHIHNLYSQDGLIHRIEGATINDLYIDGDVFKSNTAGGLASMTLGAIIFNCHSSVNVHSIDENAGSLIGWAEYSQIVNCSSSGIVICDNNNGGLIGFANYCDIRNCFSSSLVQVHDASHYTSWRAGLLGYVRGSSVVNSYACGSVPYAGPQSISSTIGYLENTSTAHHLYGLQDTELWWMKVSYISDFEVYPEGSYSNYSLFDVNGQLLDSVTVNNVPYNLLLSALNAWVDANDTTGIYHYWAADSTGENGGYPVFAYVPCIPTIGSDSITVCDSYTWHGNVYTASTELVDTLSTMMGCDSIVTHYLIVNYGSTGTDTVSAMESYSWADSTYTASGIYQHTWPATNGCDSTVTLWLTITRTLHDTTYIDVHDTTYIDVHDTTYVDVHDTTYFDVHDTTYIQVHDTTYMTVHDTTYITVHDTTYITVHDTTYMDVPYPVHDTTFVPVHDTTYIDVHDTTFVLVHDTTYIDVHDTTYVLVHDTTYIDVPYPVYDTTIVHDTTYIDVPYPVHDTTYIDVPYPVHDTTTVTEYVYVHDTAYIDVPFPVHDTTYIDVPYPVHDTTIVTMIDTLWLTEYDTIYITLYDTVYIYDTVYVGVDNVEAVNVKLFQQDGAIVVEGTEGHPVWLYDVVGCMVNGRKREDNGKIIFDVPASGVYLVKVGDAPARRIVVIR